MKRNAVSIEPAERLNKLPPYLFAEIDRIKRELTAQGKDVVDLGVGDPDLATPSYIIEALHEAAGLKDGDIVAAEPDGSFKKDSSAKPSDLYTYRAKLKKGIDADNFWMKIYLDGREWVKEKLRLRGLDAPELKTAAGRRAKKFVDGEFAKAVEITITTTKPDKWDRYLSDVFLKRADGTEVFLNNLLLEKGLAVRKESFRLEDWE
jgi:endonuclease YncB( thermonuclease family)